MPTRKSSFALRARPRQLLALLVLASACAETPPAPLAPASTQGLARTQLSLQPVRPDEQLFADLEAQAPGTAGLYFNEQGALVIPTTTPGASAAAERAVRGFVAAGRLHGRERANAVTRPQFVPAQYTFEELRYWRDLVFDSVFTRMRETFALDLDERANRVAIALDSGSYGRARARVSARLRALGVPANAVLFRPVRRYSPATLLSPPAQVDHQTSDPLAGGLEINVQHHDGQVGTCTLGFVAERDGQLGFVSNSHCTTNYFNPDGDPAFQLFPRQVAAETVDPNAYTCGIFRCRGADAAFFASSGAVPMAIGKIVRTQSVGSLVVDQNLPYWKIVAEESDNLFGGQRVDKVGRTTGWTYGYITRTCEDFRTWNEVTRCTYEASMGAAGGDSGSPVFVITTQWNEVLLAGVLQGLDGSMARFSKLWRVKSDLGGSWVVRTSGPSLTVAPFGPTNVTAASWCNLYYFANASGGTGGYSYSWTSSGIIKENYGTDVVAAFPTEGENWISVTVTDGAGTQIGGTVWVTSSHEGGECNP